MPDDFSADITTTGLLTLQPPVGNNLGNHATATGNLETSGDRDWFAVTLQAGTTYALDVIGQQHVAGVLSNPTIMGLYDGTGTLIPNTAREGGGIEWLDARLLFTAPTTGTYYLSAGSNDGRTGSYTVAVTDNWDQAGSTAATSTAMPAFTGNPGQTSMSGRIEWSGDIDWHAVELEAGTSYMFGITGYYEYTTRSYFNADIQGVYDASGTYMPGTRDENGRHNGAASEFTPTTSGTYYVAATGAPGQKGNYSLSVIEGDYPNEPGQTPSIAVGETHTGRIHNNEDRDWIAVDLQAGESYTAVMEATGPYMGYAFIHSLRDANGVRMPGVSDRNDQGGDLAAVSFTAPTTGTYYLDVTAHLWWSASNGAYELKVLHNEYADDTSTVGRVTVGGSVRGNLEYHGDVDWIAVDFVAGSTYRVDMRGVDSGGGSLADPLIYSIRDASGAHQTGSSNQNSGVGRDAQVFFTAQTTGTHYIDARHYIWNSNGSGYTVDVTEVADDFAADTTTTGMLAAGADATGSIEAPMDVDWFAMTLMAGTSYRIDVKSDSGAATPLSDPALAGIHDGVGSLIPGTPANDGGTGRNATQLFTPDADGTYYAAVTGQGAGLGDYTVTLTPRITLTGDSGDNWLQAGNLGGAELGGVDGRNGVDTVSFDGAAGPVVINLHTDEVQVGGNTLRMQSIENATGSSHDDRFFGSDRAETFRGLAGDDMFWGSDGGRDVYDGGVGRDTVTYAGATFGVEASLLRGRGSEGWAEADIFRFIENLTGTEHADVLTGDHGRNFLFGLNGDDVIMGNGGDDYILAGFGSDTIVFSGNQADYTITRNGIRTEVIDSVAGRDGHDVIGHGDILRFADGDLLL